MKSVGLRNLSAVIFLSLTGCPATSVTETPASSLPLTAIGIVAAARVNGRVSLTAGNRTEALMQNLNITEGTRINTGTDSDVSLSFSNGVWVYLGHDSELVVEKFAQQPFKGTFNASIMIEEPSISQTSLRLLHGEIAAHLVRLHAERGSSFVVLTPVGPIVAAGEYPATFHFVFRPQESMPATVSFSVGSGNASFQPPAGLPMWPDEFFQSSSVDDIFRIKAARNDLPPDAHSPQPQRARPPISSDLKLGTASIGLTDYNAKWSNYGAYLQKLIDAIDARWQSLFGASRTYPRPGSRVNVTFTMDSTGRIASIGKIDGDAGDLATNWCVSAISLGSVYSYGPWPNDMIATLGTSQRLTFTFLYR